jgi:hypothetical protein
LPERFQTKGADVDGGSDGVSDSVMTATPSSDATSSKLDEDTPTGGFEERRVPKLRRSLFSEVSAFVSEWILCRSLESSPFHNLL